MTHLSVKRLFVLSDYGQTGEAAEAVVKLAKPRQRLRDREES